MEYLEKLLHESVHSSDITYARPALLALTRATTKLIYQDLVATQYTSQPIAALYGVKYLNPNKELTFVTGATYGGQYGTDDRVSIPELDLTNATTFMKGDLFKYQNVVFKVIVDTPFAGSTETDLFDLVSEGIAAAAIRMAPEAAETSKFESNTAEIAEAAFEINKWQAAVKSRKLKAELTIELAQDMQASGFDAPETIEDLLATQMAEEINKDVIQSLITVSSRYKVKGVSDKGILDLSTGNSSVEQARTLYRFICEMNASIQRNTSYSATYVLASSRAAALLASSGWLQKPEPGISEAAYGVLNNGLVVYCDNNSPAEYVIVGVKDEYGEKEMVGSLFYAPYAEGLSKEADPTDHIGTYKLINDPDSLQPKLALLVRYALCVNPYTMGINDADAKVIDASDMDNFVGRSQMSVLLGVKLPKLV